MHTSLLDHGNSVMQKIAPSRERVGGKGRGRGRRGSAVLETVTKCQEVRNLWQFSFPLILFTLFPCLFTIRHFKLHFIRNSNTRSTVDLTQDGTFFENLEYALKIRYSGKKIGKKIANDFTIFLQNSVSSFLSECLHFSSTKTKKKRKRRKKRKNSFLREESFSRRAATSKKIILKPRVFRIATTFASCVLAFSLPPFPSLTLVRRSTKYEGEEEVDDDIRSAAPRNPKIFATNSFFTARNAPSSHLRPRPPFKVDDEGDDEAREESRSREKSSSRALQRVIRDASKFSQTGKINFFAGTHERINPGWLQNPSTTRMVQGRDDI